VPHANVQADLPPDHAERVARMRLSLDGLSVGDAFGDVLMFGGNWAHALRERRLAPPPWLVTDDTMMAVSIVEQLDALGRIDQDDLARRFAERFGADPNRGYGLGAMRLLTRLVNGADWRAEAGAMFGGTGSMGNGSAMRVAPLGAYFADDLDAVVEQAALSAGVTHAHPEGGAGAIAVAVAAAEAWRIGRDVTPAARRGLIEAALARTPEGATKAGIARALDVPLHEPPDRAARRLGNGSEVTCPDTVPLCLWCAARHLDRYEEAIWATASALGDCDTTCAIVGGIVALAAGRDSLPDAWLDRREPLPEPPGRAPRRPPGR